MHYKRLLEVDIRFGYLVIIGALDLLPWFRETMERKGKERK